MALKLWMPLTEDTHNQGLSATSCTTTNTFVSGGKIGNCMKSTVATNTGLPYTEWNYATSSISICCWVKFNLAEIQAVCPSTAVNETYKTFTGTLLGYHNYGGLGLIWKTNDVYTSGNVSNILLFGGYRNASNYATGNYTVPFDLWVFMALIFNRETNKLSLYANNTLISSVNINATDYLKNADFLMCAAYVSEGNAAARSIPCRINDVRVYDLALTLQEIKEVGKGLILHYTCDDISLHSGKLYDSSGYCNDGTVYGTLTTSTDTPRYDKCTENASTGIIMLPTSLFNLKDEITLSYWAYRSDWTTWYSESGGLCSFMSNLEGGGIAIIRNTATNIEFIVGTGTTSNSYQYVIINPTLSSGWHHFAITCDGQTLKGYIDGEEVATKSWSTKTPIFYNTSAGYFLFGESGSSQTTPSSYTKGKLSDVRIYTTALSSDDIKALYNESAFIDYKGNIGCYLFYEDADSQITKTGQIRTEEFEEISDLSDGVAKVYELKIECNQLIEI